MSTLDEIGFRHGTDKSSRICHGYLPIYEQFFGGRNAPITLLELGVQNGFSLRTWREWFTVATLVGVDHGPPPPGLDLWNTHVYQADQADPALPELLAPHGPFDVIIDDASHLSTNTIASFELLWPLVKPGGVYVVEDLACHDDTRAQEHLWKLSAAWGWPGLVSAEHMARLYHEQPSEYAFIRLSRNLAIIGKSP